MGAGGPAAALLFTHGNAELIDYWVAEFQAFADRGIGVLLLEYPGYGRSTGKPTYRAVRESVLAAFDWLADIPEVDATRIVPFGRSVGGGPACIVAHERHVPALILHATFVSLRPFARRFLMPGWLIRVPFENLDVVREFDGPVLLVHGRRDLVVPYWHGRRLAEAARDPHLMSYDRGHNDCPPSWAAHVDDVLDFLAGAGVSSRP